MSGLDPTEAIEAAAKEICIGAGPQDDTTACGDCMDAASAAVTAAAPIIARLVAEKIAERIEAEAAALDHFPPNDYRLGMSHGLAGSAEHDIIGAARIAREVGSDG